MNLGAAFSALFTRAKAEVNTGAADVKERNWSSLRWLGLLAFVGLIVYNATSHLLTEAALLLVFKAFVVWVVCNTVTRAVSTVSNAWVRIRLGTAFDADGVLTAEEKEALLALVPPETPPK